jgi:hypothetical protein
VGLDDEELQRMDEFCQYTDPVMRGVIAQMRASSKWNSVVESVVEWCHDLGYEVDPADPLFTRLVRDFARAERKALSFISARNNGDDPPEAELAPKSGTRLSDMNDAFVKHKSTTVGRKPVSMALSIWKKFIGFKGDVFLDEVTSNDIYRFFQARLFTDSDKWSEGYVYGHVKRALKDFFALARTMNVMTADNPVTKLEIVPRLPEQERKKRLKPRFPFSSEQINILLSSEWYRPRSTQFRGKLGDDLAARYFGPLIGLLHGMRVREFLQLMTSDILVADGVLCFKFQTELETDEETDPGLAKSRKGRPDAQVPLPERTVKNLSVLRTIPVHPKLIELGFADYVASHRSLSGADVPLFKSSVPKPGGKAPMWGRAFEQAFLRYARDKLAFGAGYGSHSFRHQFEGRIRDTQARKGIWPAGLPQLLTGRLLPRDADRDFFRDIGSERGYGNGYKPSAALPFIEKLIFDDISFPIVFNSWLKQK